MCWTKNKLNLNVCEQCLLTICVIFIRKSFYEISYEEYVTEESTSSYVQVIVILRFLQVPISTASVALLNDLALTLFASLLVYLAYFIALLPLQ